MSGPTDTKSHTLDLVFTLGLNTDCISSEDIFIFDHCNRFNLFLSSCVVRREDPDAELEKKT